MTVCGVSSSGLCRARAAQALTVVVCQGNESSGRVWYQASLSKMLSGMEALVKCYECPYIPDEMPFLDYLRTQNPP